MTLNEAIRTGRRFRRAGEAVWCKTQNNVIVVDSAARGTRPHRDLTAADILADDWHDEEPEVTVTRRRIIAAVVYTMGLGDEDPDTLRIGGEVADYLGAK